jgi:hypothetical protein
MKYLDLKIAFPTAAIYIIMQCINPFKDETQTALFKDPVRTAL